MSEAIGYALSRATPDVVATFRWLTEQGATLTRERGGPHEAFGDVLVEFTLDDAVVTITRDRCQWMLDLQCGQLPRFDFDVVHAALAGDHEWSARSRPDQAPDQLPDGVSWVAELPSAMEWLRSTPDAVDRLTRLGHQRADAIFGPMPDR